MFESDIHNTRIDAIRRGNAARTTSRFDARETRGKLTATKQPPRTRGRAFYRRRTFWAAVLAALIIGTGVKFGSTLFSLTSKVFVGSNPLSIISGFGQLFSAPDRPLTGESNGRVNILLLGIGGEGHEGALLTDTMILASIKVPEGSDEKPSITLTSIPRDYVVKLPAGLEYRKINSAYAYGELNGKDLGAKWAIESVANLSGLAIPYYALIDFSGFKQAIDDLGGVDIHVDNSFSDSSYPDYRKGYLPTLRFEKGWEHMDGERALQYSRSRHGTNGEGSDFARSRRQQKVLEAMKAKAEKLKISSDIGTLTKLIGNFADHFKTNMQPWEIRRLYQISQQTPNDHIASLALDPTTGLVCNAIVPETGAYILDRCPGVTAEAIKAYFAQSFSLAQIASEAPSISILNSTKTPGLAQRAKESLAAFASDKVTSDNYPGTSAIKGTVIYDLTSGKKPASLAYLSDVFQSTESHVSYPYSDSLKDPKPDFIVVLGTDSIDRYPTTTTTTTRAPAATTTPESLSGAATSTAPASSTSTPAQ